MLSVVPIPLAKDYKSPCVLGVLSLQLPSTVSTMMDSCRSRNTTAIPAVPTISTHPSGGNFRNGICLTSSCRSRENCQPPSSVPSGCEPAPGHPTCLPAASCVGFVCRPVCSCVACYESGTGQSPRLVSSCQPSCSEPAGAHAEGCEASPGQQSSHQEPVFVSGRCQAAHGQSVCCDTRARQPSCSEVPCCLATSCPPSACAASPCQPTCCQAGSGRPISGEDQPCKSTYYQPICYIFKACQSVPYMPVPSQPSTCVFSSCNPACCVSSSCQSLHCQPASSMYFMCQPVATCQPPCKPASWGTVLSGQPACARPTSRTQSGYKSPSYQPACCVTGLGRSSRGGSNGF